MDKATFIISITIFCIVVVILIIIAVGLIVYLCLRKKKQANNVSRIHSSQPSHIHPLYNDNATAAKSATTKPIVAPLFNLPPALSP